MKKLCMLLIVLLSLMTLLATDAQARRLGGGSTIGRQSSQNFKSPAPAQSAQPAAAPAPGAAPGRPSVLRNVVGGALIGMLVGGLFSHFGAGGAFIGMASAVLVLGLLAFFVIFIFRLLSRGKPAVAQAYSANGHAGQLHTPEIGSGLVPATQAPLPLASGAAYDTVRSAVPADFDVPAFVRSAKAHFIRLQAAWDRADIDDIREFTTPEMFGELRLQLQERGATPNQTDVVSLDGELYGIETVGEQYIASIKFSGLIKEAANAPTEPFAEAWNLAKPVNGNGGWLLAGIQQLS